MCEIFMASRLFCNLILHQRKCLVQLQLLDNTYSVIEWMIECILIIINVIIIIVISTFTLFIS